MISVTELRAGTAFELDGAPYRVLEYKHTKMGRGTANIRIKAKNLLTGAVGEKNFVSGAKVQEVELELKTYQYLYQDGENYFFADPRTFDQVSLAKSVVGDKGKYLREGGEVKILLWANRLLDLDLPVSMIFTVAQTAPGVRGNSVVASFKPATFDNGLSIKVPLFINEGDKIKVDTRTGEYLERVK